MKGINSKWIEYFVQFAFIFSSVYFAFWLTNKGEERRIQDLERKAITSVYLEIRQNLVSVETEMEYHKTLWHNLTDYIDSLETVNSTTSRMKAPDHMKNIFTRQSNSFALPNVKSTAYETFANTEAHLSTKFEIANSLADLYKIQKIGIERTMSIMTDQVSTNVGFHRPELALAYLDLVAWTYRELYGQEIFLTHKMNEVLNLLETEYPHIMKTVN